MLMPVYNMRRDTAQVYLRPRWREGERADMLFFAILEPMDSEGHSAIFNRLDHDRVRREERTPKDAFRWQPYQVRSLKAHEQRSPALYRTSWDFTDPMKSLERLFRQRENSADLERKLKQLESGVYVHVPTTAAPRRAPRNP
ncbi:MAG: hypothetical protein ABIO72_00870 [Patescibacteria group bacterium]